MLHNMEAMMRAGCATRRAIRHWETEGLLGTVERSDGDTRKYTDEQLDKARVIAAAQFGGFDLGMVAEMLKSYDTEVYEALMSRLEDQIRAAVRLGDNLPKPPAPVPAGYDL